MATTTTLDKPKAPSTGRQEHSERRFQAKRERMLEQMARTQRRRDRAATDPQTDENFARLFAQ